MQSVVLGRRQPSFYETEREGGGCEPPGGFNLAELIRYLLRSLLPLPCKKEAGSRSPREIDAESIDPDRLERMINAARKFLRRDKEDDDESAEIVRSVEFDDSEKPRRMMRAREGRRRRGGYWRRNRLDEAEDDGYTRRRNSKEEDESGRPWRKRRTNRRRNRSWEDVDEDRSKKISEEERLRKAFEAEWDYPKKEEKKTDWESSRRDSWTKKSPEVIYFPPPFPPSRHFIRPRSEDYIR